MAINFLSSFSGIIFMNKVNIFTTFFGLLLSLHTLADNIEQLNDELLFRTLTEFQKAMENNDRNELKALVFEDAKYTAHFKSGKFSDAKELLIMDLLNIPTEGKSIPITKRQNIKIEYYKNNTQALMTYKMLIPEMPDAQTEDQILFEIKNGKVVISRMIVSMETIKSSVD